MLYCMLPHIFSFFAGQLWEKYCNNFRGSKTKCHSFPVPFPSYVKIPSPGLLVNISSTVPRKATEKEVTDWEHCCCVYLLCQYHLNVNPQLAPHSLRLELVWVHFVTWSQAKAPARSLASYILMLHLMTAGLVSEYEKARGSHDRSVLPDSGM